jgi:hypothetical protein
VSHPLATRLAEAFVGHFSSADREITWTASEQERSLWLSPNTLLIGRVDARGLTSDGQPFFGEWKTMSAYRGRYMEEEKIKWRTNPQALTYGVLVPETNRFCVRWAVKPDERSKNPVVKCDFEWYTYTPAEIEHWRKQLLGIANEIRLERLTGVVPWRTNFGNCYRYGMKYACPFVGLCSRQAWAESAGAPRVPHTALEATVGDLPPEVVVLSSSRVSDYLECPEAYRRKWEGEGHNEESEALTIGTDFHGLVAAHINSLIKQKEPTHDNT